MAAAVCLRDGESLLVWKLQHSPVEVAAGPCMFEDSVALKPKIGRTADPAKTGLDVHTAEHVSRRVLKHGRFCACVGYLQVLRVPLGCRSRRHAVFKLFLEVQWLDDI